MNPEDSECSFSDAALLLAAHGSTANPGSALPARIHASEIRKRALFAEVAACFLQEKPGLREGLVSLSARRVFVVPLFISEGYFTREIIPRELGLPAPGADGMATGRTPDGKPLFYCTPVGTHPGMTEILLARATETIARHPAEPPVRLEAATLFIAGHGTERNRDSRKVVERQVAILRERAIFAAVHPLFMEEEPAIPRCYELAATRDLIVVPFFISDGLHVTEDIPVLLGESAEEVRARLRTGRAVWNNPTERHRRRVWYTPGVGTAPGVVDLILERVREAAAASVASAISAVDSALE